MPENLPDAGPTAPAMRQANARSRGSAVASRSPSPSRRWLGRLGSAATLAVVASVALSGCSATRGVRPVGKGNTAVGLSLGGPFFSNLGPAIPIPLVSVHARHGVGERTDVDVGLHAPIIGAFGVDAGASYLLVDQKGARPALSVGGRALLWGSALSLSGKDNPNTGEGYPFSVRLFEQAYANVSWKLGETLTLWTGLDLFAQVERLTVLPSLVAGAEWRPCAKPWIPGITVEAKHLALLSNQRFEVVDFIGPAGYGAFALQLGLNFQLGGAR